ncbi:uncharacterized protein LOC122082867 [Macadamia integrifolia]|uniref:uncharacterized protein LOC122082867 n=1 Tax=Macadamia integrifolia TaxID=60698 RepID=UPI001C4F68DE|nr:uncharacterized protein LOC122082867 [Macadamia integrifolia]
MDTPVSLIEQKMFHSIDRELYSRILMDLNLRVTQARQVLVLWLWLEEIGFPNVIAKILEMSNSALRFVVDEAVICLDSVLLDYNLPSPECDLPMTISILGKDISLKFFIDHKKSLTEGMIRIMQHISSTVFEDLEQLASVVTAFKATYLDSSNEGTSRGTVVDSREKQIIQAPGTFPRLQLRPHGEGSSRGTVVDGKETQKMMYALESFARPQFIPQGEGSSRGTVVHGAETPVIQAPASFARLQFIPHGEGSSRGMVVHGRETPMMQAPASFARPQFIPHGEGSSRGTMFDGRETQMKQALEPFHHLQLIPTIWPPGEGTNHSMVVDDREAPMRQTPPYFPPLHMVPMIRHNVESSSGMYQMNQGQMSFYRSQLNVNARPWEEYVPECDRTMFITFSRGHPLTEEEIREFLTGIFGDCIESITMQKVTQPHEDPVYAHVIFKLASTVTLILNGSRKAKFSYKGKHIWARRWEKRDPYFI